MTRSKSFGIFGATVALTGAIFAPAARAELDLKTRNEAFQAVWQRVRDGHWDPTFGGVNWDAVRAKYAPKVRATKSDSEFYGLLSAMLGELKQSHFGIIPPAAFVAQSDAKASGSAETGVTASLVENMAVVTHVSGGSPAEKAGVKPGDAIIAIDGLKISPMLGKIQARKQREGAEQVEVRILLRALLMGSPDTKATLVLKAVDGTDRTVEVGRELSNAPMGTFGLLPPLPLEVESKTLPGGIGYVRFNIFLAQNIAGIQAAVDSFASAPGLIIDLRGNPGGLGAMAMRVGGIVTDKKGSLGTMRTRTTTISFPVNPQPPRFSAPVAILIDEMSLSTSEILAGGLQEMGRATIIGRRTGGMVLPSVIENLPGGARLQRATADFRTPKGTLLEGRGVIPDVPVTFTRERLSKSPDLVLDMAQEFLKSKILEKK